MNLLKDTQAALDYTLRLRAALNLDNVDLCTEMLELRGQAMAVFEASHRQATNRERTACLDEIQALVKADQELQAESAASLNVIAREFRERLVSNQPHPGQGYLSSPLQACVDRMA